MIFKHSFDIFHTIRKFKQYLASYYNRKAMWSTSERQDLLTRGNNTNNFCEAAMRVLKDKVLERTKAFNIPQLVDFLTNHLHDHYQQRLVDVANGRLEYVTTSRYMLVNKNIPKDDIKQVSIIF